MIYHGYFLEHECIFCGYTSRFMTQSTRLMTTANLFPYTHVLQNSCLTVLEIIKLNKRDFEE